MAPHNDLVLYHYSFSPFARKVVWYLTLRGIDYAQCPQPSMLPRPDLAAIGVKYRRIPVLAHGNDVYCDTRLITAHLDAAFPASSSHPGLAPESPFDRAYTTLLEKWTVTGGIFQAAAATLDPDLPVLQDPTWRADRKDFSGNSWERGEQAAKRGPALAVIRDAFALLEDQVLADGRHWILGGDRPSRADIDAVWPFHWLDGLPGSLDRPDFDRAAYPKTYAWIKRFDDAIKAAKKTAPKPATIKGEDAASQVLAAKSTPLAKGVDAVDGNDPLGLKSGQLVEANPTDTGFNHKDKGKLVGLDRNEVVMEAEAPGGKTVRIHYPRINFKIKALDGAKL